MTGPNNARRAAAAARRDSETGRLDGPATIAEPRHLTLRITGADFDALTAAAVREGIARSDLVRRIIAAWVAAS